MGRHVFITDENEPQAVAPDAARDRVVSALSKASTATDADIVLWRLRQIGREA